MIDKATEPGNHVGIQVERTELPLNAAVNPVAGETKTEPQTEQTAKPDDVKTHNREGYLQRQLEKAQAELEALRSKEAERQRSEMTELEKVKADLDAKNMELETVRKRAIRLEAINAAGLPPELAVLVPNDMDTKEALDEFIAANIMPLHKKLSEAATVGVVTNPAQTSGSERSKYDEYISLLESNPTAAQSFYNQHHSEIRREASVRAKG